MQMRKVVCAAFTSSLDVAQRQGWLDQTVWAYHPSTRDTPSPYEESPQPRETPSTRTPFQT